MKIFTFVSAIVLALTTRDYAHDVSRGIAGNLIE